MRSKILIIDDARIQAENLKKALHKVDSNLQIDIAYEEQDIINKIKNTFFNIAIVDLRMDSFSIDGFSIIDNIIEVNPFARIIIVSAFLKEYTDDLNKIVKTGRVSSIIDKEDFKIFVEKIQSEIKIISAQYFENRTLSQNALVEMLADSKNETDSYLKGIKFERFVLYLFSNMGFNNINMRNKDKSSNEVDLIVRNDLSDPFFDKLKPYFLVECKNHIESVDKNQFILFQSKLKNAQLANLGFIITSSGFKRTTYLEAMRESHSENKVIFISSRELEQMINSNNSLDALKLIIDNQVKDN